MAENVHGLRWFDCFPVQDRYWLRLMAENAHGLRWGIDRGRNRRYCFRFERLGECVASSTHRP